MRAEWFEVRPQTVQKNGGSREGGGGGGVQAWASNHCCVPPGGGVLCQFHLEPTTSIPLECPLG